MANEARRAYVEAQVQTAPPQQLRLMLIEAAIGHIGAATRLARENLWGSAGEPFVQARRVVIALLESITSEEAAPNEQSRVLAAKVRSLYGYLFRTLTEAQLYRDAQRLDDALRLFELERETWRVVCERSESGGRAIAVSDDESESCSFEA